MLIAFPHKPGSGGPGSFQTRFESTLSDRGWSIIHGVDDGGALPDVVMVVGGTRKLAWLNRLKRKGVPIIYRLDGRLWLHRINGFQENPIRWLGSEVRNAMSQWIHGRLADCVVYQSQFVRDWWQREGWWQPSDSAVIPNGLDLDEFRPNAQEVDKSSDPRNLVCVEGHIDYSPYAIDLLNWLVGELNALGARLVVYGGFSDSSAIRRLDARVDYRGSISRQAIAEVYRGRVFLSLDVNPACPNAVAEALASGAPVIGFDTGSVKELVGEEGGCIVPFGSDPWKGEFPDLLSLIDAYREVSENFEVYSTAARLRAEQSFGLDRMVDAYIKVVERTIERCKN